MVDWSKYPPLPTPPIWPHWRGTPISEAYLANNRGSVFFSAKKDWILIGSFLVFWFIFLMATFYRSVDNLAKYDGIKNVLIFVIFAIMFAALSYFFIRIIYLVVFWVKLYRIYGAGNVHADRPDISEPIATIFAERPVFDIEKFSS